MKTVTTGHHLVAKKPEPFVRFSDFGDSSLVFKVYFWTNNVFRAENIKSDLRIKYFTVLKEHNIEIPIPQRVLHFRENIDHLKDK